MPLAVALLAPVLFLTLSGLELAEVADFPAGGVETRPDGEPRVNARREQFVKMPHRSSAMNPTGTPVAFLGRMWSLKPWFHSIVALGGLGAATVVFAQAPRAPIFRGGVDLVALDVCVTDRNGQFLPALDSTDFIVLEDRVPQPLTFFSSEGAVPLTAVVLIDRSSSMIGTKLERAKEAALTFLRQLGPNDRAAVLAFDRRTQRIVPFDTDLADATSLVAKVTPSGMTALFDAMLVGLRELQSARGSSEMPRRQALVVLSDGEDSASGLSADEVYEEAQRAGVIVYSISLRLDPHGRSLPPLHEFARFANDSGGRVIAVQDLTTLDAVYAEIATELRHMYRLAYVPTASRNDGRWRTVSVRVLGRDARARTRSGYFATGPASRWVGQ